MGKKISLFSIFILCLTLLIPAQEGIITPKHNKIFLGVNYQLESGEFLTSPIKFYGLLFEYDFKPRYKFGLKLMVDKEYNSWLGDGWELMLIPRRYFSFRDSSGALTGIVGVGIAYKIPSRLYYSYNIESKEHIYVKERQLLGKWKSVVIELGLKGRSFGRMFFETTLIIKPLNFFVKDRTELNGFVGVNSTLLYCLKK